MPPNSLIPKHGAYRTLISYQKAEIVYDATVFFCKRYLSRKDRTFDQMVQAARSGKQNIVEGSVASATSKEMELKLTQVARASLEELLTDYRDFLRSRKLPEWPRGHPLVARLRKINRTSPGRYSDFQKGIEHENMEISANVIIGLVKLTCFLLDRQVRALEKIFLKEGGFREKMTRMRRQVR